MIVLNLSRRNLVKFLIMPTMRRKTSSSTEKLPLISINQEYGIYLMFMKSLSKVREVKPTLFFCKSITWYSNDQKTFV